MKPYYADDWLTILEGDCRAVLPSLPADSVDCVVTSPPYWGLRDYGNDGQLGLERTPEEYVANMVAVFADVRRVLKPSGTCWLNLGDSYNSSSQNNHGKGGTKEQPGLTPDEWAGHRSNVPGLKPKDLVGIPWRVAFALQADGWYLRSEIIWNKPNPMPESVTDRPTKSHEQLFLLTKSPRYYFDQEAVRESAQQGSQASVRAVREGQGDGTSSPYLTGWAGEGPALLLHGQGQGSDGPLPAVGEGPRIIGAGSSQATGGHADREHADGRGVDGNQGHSGGPVPLLRAEEAADDGPSRPDLDGWAAHSGERGGGVSELQQQTGQSGRNLRSVWTIATRPYPGAHFAVFPPELPERCIKAGSSERGVCPETGEPWERWVERSGTMDRSKYAHRKDNNDPTARQVTGGTAGTVEVSNGQEWAKWKAEHPDKQLGWRPTCGAPWERVIERGPREQSANGTTERPEYIAVKGGAGATSVLRDGKIATRIEKGWSTTCEHASSTPVPAVVLDPFAGSGTVGMVANRLSRRAILIDLNPEYLKQQMTRNAQTPLGLGAA